MVPLALWTAILTALFALGGLVIVNQSRRKDLLLQLAEDGIQKEKDRKAQAKAVEVFNKIYNKQE